VDDEILKYKVKLLNHYDLEVHKLDKQMNMTKKQFILNYKKLMKGEVIMENKN